MSRYLLVTALVVVAFLGCTSTHNAPVTVAVTLLWTAPGDDGSVGTATAYDFRWALDSMSLKNAWSGCAVLLNPPAPLVAGSAQTWTFNQSVELGTRYFYAVKTVDDAGNWSQISNVATRLWPDTMPPSPIVNLRTP